MCVVLEEGAILQLYEALLKKKEKLAVIGLGYVGLPLAVAFSHAFGVIGFDSNSFKINKYRNGSDVTQEVGEDAVAASGIEFTDDASALQKARFHVVAVPTPIHADRTPDLSCISGASEIVGKNLVRGSIVVYESTVYPGVTEDICIPILEKASGLRCGADFKVGYSPERINPGDKVHRLEDIVKIVSGMDADALETIAKVYSTIVNAGVYRAESIRIAEAAKVIENCQRDINIAFMNELSMIFHRMGIDTQAVLRAAGTKWNFLSFAPGLVGGHCIGVDPYYLTYKAEELGYHSQIILSGRQINDGMGKFIAEHAVKNLIRIGKPLGNARIAILGFTFKENCQDTRNSKVYDIVKELMEYGIAPVVADPVADAGGARIEYGVNLADVSQIKDMDVIVLAVAHDKFKQMSSAEFDAMYGAGKKIMIDVKGILDAAEYEKKGYYYWRL